MKIGTWILTIWLAASAGAQTAATKAQMAPQGAAKPTGVIAASLPTKTAAAAVRTTAPAAKPAAPAAQKAAEAKQQPATSAAATSGAALTAKQGTATQGTAKQRMAKDGKRQKVAQQPAEAKPVSATKSVHKGRRDPFVSPIVERMRGAASCTGAGKRCLYIGDVALLGIVQSSNGVIAVVASGRHTYFLREHDPLADGNVERITSDAITLRQRSSDVMGRPVVREVTRKIGSPAV